MDFCQASMDICPDADEQLQNDVSVSADFAVSCILGTAQSGKSSKESKDEEMAPDASVGKKRKKQIDDATQREKKRGGEHGGRGSRGEARTVDEYV